MNLKLKILLLVVGGWSLVALSGCNQPQQTTQKAPFPPEMVGTWETWFSPEQKWAITFAEDGAIPEVHHYLFGPMTAEEGGIHKDGPDPGTYMVAVLGPLETEFDLRSQVLKATITIESYTMKFVEGELKGRMIDKIEGALSKDGRTWEVEWRDYGWLEGAADPPMDVIDENPRIIKFRKVEKVQ